VSDTFTVVEIVGQNEWAPADDPSKKTVFWDFKAKEAPGVVCSIGRKPGNDLKVGESFEATSREDRGKLKLKKVQQGNFNGGGKRDEPFKADPAKQRAIIRQSAQKAALEYAALRHQQGKLPDDFNFTMLKPIVDWFYEDSVHAMNTEPAEPFAPPRTDQW
jgi:hypothetical protein